MRQLKRIKGCSLQLLSVLMHVVVIAVTHYCCSCWFNSSTLLLFSFVNLWFLTGCSCCCFNIIVVVIVVAVLLTISLSCRKTKNKKKKNKKKSGRKYNLNAVVVCFFSFVLFCILQTSTAVEFFVYFFFVFFFYDSRDKFP